MLFVENCADYSETTDLSGRDDPMKSYEQPVCNGQLIRINKQKCGEYRGKRASGAPSSGRNDDRLPAFPWGGPMTIRIEIGCKRRFQTGPVSGPVMLGVALMAILSTSAHAQPRGPMGPPRGGYGNGGNGYGNAGAVATAHMQPYSFEGGFMNAHGDSVVNPASYGAPCGPGGGCGPVAGGGCGPMGYGPGGGGGGGMDPFGGYGANVEQCGPHYFDFSAEYLSYERSNSPLGNSTFSTFGFANLVNGAADPVAVLNQQAIGGDDIGGGEYDGYRLTGRIDIGALSVFEISYSGLYDNDAGTAVAIADVGNLLTPGDLTDNATLYTVFTDFGSGTGGVIAGPDFEETDDALEHRVSYESELHSVEASYRRYWVGYSPRISGTMLIGFRYTELQERLAFFSRSDDGSINIGLESDNRLAGVQVGGDGWITLLQGLRVGGEVKVGLYNNQYQSSGTSVAADGTPNLASAQKDSEVAFLTEMRASVVADLTPNFSAKAGYEVLYISGLALAADNLLANPPYGGASVPVSSDGNATWHGWHAGLEYVY